MVQLLVGVVVGRLEEHLLRLLGQLVLLVQLNPVLQLVDIFLLGAHFTLLNRLLLRFVCSLEVYLRLQVARRIATTDSLGLGQVAWRVRAGLVLEERVRVRGLGSEPRRRHKFCTRKKSRCWLAMSQLVDFDEDQNAALDMTCSGHCGTYLRRSQAGMTFAHR